MSQNSVSGKKSSGKRGPSKLTGTHLRDITYLWREIGRVLGYEREHGRLPNAPRYVKNAIIGLYRLQKEHESLLDEMPAHQEIVIGRTNELFDQSVRYLAGCWIELRKAKNKSAEENWENKIGEIILQIKFWLRKNRKSELPAEFSAVEKREFLALTKQTDGAQEGNLIRAAELLSPLFPKGEGNSLYGFRKRRKKKNASPTRITFEKVYFYNLCALDPDRADVASYLESRARDRTYFDYCGAGKESGHDFK